MANGVISMALSGVVKDGTVLPQRAKLTAKELRAAVRKLRENNRNSEYIEIPVPCYLCGKAAMHTKLISGEDYPFCSDCAPMIDSHIEWIEATDRWLEKLGENKTFHDPLPRELSRVDLITLGEYYYELFRQQKIAGG